MSPLRRQLTVLFWITRCDFKLRDQGTFLGFIWTLLNPILMFAVLYLVFSSWFERIVPHYPVYLILGILHWNFFALATSNAVTIFERKRHLLKSFALGGCTLPIAAVLTVFFSYLFESLLVLVLCGIGFGLTLSGTLWFIALLFINLIVAMGVGLLLANAFIFVRDVSHLWNLALRVGFFVTPVFYPLNVIDDRKLAILKLNPLFHLFNSSRDAIIKGSVELNGDFVYLIAASCLLLLLSVRLYRTNQDKLVERL